MDKTAFIDNVKKDIEKNLPREFLTIVSPYLVIDRLNMWEIAVQLGELMNHDNVTDQQKDFCRQTIQKIREFQGFKAINSRQPSKIVFGTSGWRGLIGEEFTFFNVSKVVRAIIDMMKTEVFLETNGYQNFSEVQQNGILLFRDNRYQGDDFIKIANNELVKEGIKTYNAGQCPTGVGSALVNLLGVAGSINFTPSHNPMQYAGLKFNPADGGPAGKNLTQLIEANCDRYMQLKDYIMSDEKPLPELLNAAAVFRRYIEDCSEVFDIEAIRQWLIEVSQDILLVIDFMHGAARGYLEELLGQDVMDQLRSTDSVVFLNTEDDYSFHGVKPEPSAKNQQNLIVRLKEKPRKYSLAVALDPDADRIRFSDASMDIDMNKFGPMAYLNLLQRGFQGSVATTVASTDIAFEVARKNQQEFIETAVGFKNFRDSLLSGKVIVAFEESDGITFKGHTLEKCAIGGFLAALDLMMSTSANLSQFYQKMISDYGNYLPGKGSREIKGLSVAQWLQFSIEFMDYLKQKQFIKQQCIKIGEKELTVVDLIQIDGLKVLLNDGSWLLFRPSGTEPKIKYYYEVVLSQKAQVETILKDYQDYCEDILKEVKTQIENN